MVSDRRTCALLDQRGTLCWYCPGQFDSAAVFSQLLDADKGGFWAVETEGQHFRRRAYLERSSILTTYLEAAGQEFSITDWMPLNEDFSGLCRQLSAAPGPVLNTIWLRPDYGLQAAEVQLLPDGYTAALPAQGLWLRASHPLRQVGDCVQFTIPAGAEGWAVLTDTPGAAQTLSAPRLAASFDHTAQAWRELADLLRYEGPYRMSGR